MGIGGISIWQILIILLVILVLFGGKKIRNMGSDLGEGLKGFKKNSYFVRNNFISKKFFFDLELIHLFSKKKLKIVSIKTIFDINKNSSIRIFNFKNNYYILKELIHIWIVKK